jgi:hypothetical protein
VGGAICYQFTPFQLESYLPPSYTVREIVFTDCTVINQISSQQEFLFCYVFSPVIAIGSNVQNFGTYISIFSKVLHSWVIPYC